jgi:hypothetical protein
MTKKIDMEAWVELFHEVGLSDEQMKQWHRLFEKRYPQSHADFLVWLGISDVQVAEIRAAFK